jgi:putative ABC transport system ATP-binding protein
MCGGLSRSGVTQLEIAKESLLLKMQAVTKVFRTEQVETHALRALDLHIAEGEFVAVTGPSGSGKTTFLNVAGLLDGFTSGRYELDGEDVTGLDDQALSKLRGRKLGFIFQGFNLVPELDIYNNVELPLRYRGMPRDERKKLVEDTVSRVGLTSRIRHWPSQLSGGQQQRVAIARALAGSPKLLLADEPTGNLDTEMANGVMELLTEIHRAGATIVMVTHNDDLADRAQRRVQLVDGVAKELGAKQIGAPQPS